MVKLKVSGTFFLSALVKPSRERHIPAIWTGQGNVVLTVAACLSLLLCQWSFAQDAPLPRSHVIGLANLKMRLNPLDLPTGFGVIASHVEGGQDNAYTPNIRDARYAGTQFMLRSGVSKVGGHADATAKIIYGSQGLAPGIKEVHCYRAFNWLKEGCLFTGTNQPPKSDGSDLLNHSWIAGNASAFTVQALRRLDYLIDTTDTIAVIGVNNGPTTPVPPLLASCYNGIAVGRDNGQSSGGRTQIEGKGRSKPDLVAPGGLTSFSTPVVSASAAMMIQLAKAHPQSEHARKAQVIKAILMAGAVKSQHWKHYPERPLDVHLGAGVVNVEHSYDIIKQSPTLPGMMQEDTGWSYFEITPRQMHSWYWDVKQDLADATIALVWHRRIDGRQLTDSITRKTIWIDQPYLADLDIKLISLDQGQIASSHSTVDNVELIHIPILKAGQYEIQVGRKDGLNSKWTAALAWFGESQN